MQAFPLSREFHCSIIFFSTISTCPYVKHSSSNLGTHRRVVPQLAVVTRGLENLIASSGLYLKERLARELPSGGTCSFVCRINYSFSAYDFLFIHAEPRNIVLVTYM